MKPTTKIRNENNHIQINARKAIDISINRKIDTNKNAVKSLYSFRLALMNHFVRRDDHHEYTSKLRILIF